MTTTLSISENGVNGISFRLSGLVLVLQALLAAGLMEKSLMDRTLPEVDSYRSPLPDTIFKSNPWRSPPIEKRDWRLPPPPPLGWRTAPSSESDISSPTRIFDIFPRYQSGSPFNYDLIEREEKPLIKMFEFGSE
jgi:hypothetical protein